MWSLRSEVAPKCFEKITEILPLGTYGLTTVQDFRKAEGGQHLQEWLMAAGLTDGEIALYFEHQSGSIQHHTKMESSVLKSKLQDIYCKIKDYQCESCSQQTESDIPQNFLKNDQDKSITFYPDGHPMHQLKELEDTLFGHLKNDRPPITKRRKILRRLERKKERILSQKVQPPLNPNPVLPVNRPGSLWDVRELPHRSIEHISHSQHKDKQKSNHLIGPKKPTMYTIKENKILRLEAIRQNEFKAVDIVMPVNTAEVRLLEGSKMSLDDIRKIDRFKVYEPGTPSKVLYLKNIAPSVTQEKLSAVFNQFVLDNGGPIDVRLMSGRMRGQAFVAFQNESVAIQALEEVNGTILSGRPIIVQFGKNSNRIQSDKNR